MNASDTNNKNRKTLKTVIVVLVSLVIAVLVLFYILFIRKPYTKPFDNYCKAIENADGNYLYASFNENIILEQLDIDKDKAIKSFKKQATSLHENMTKQYGKDFSLSYEIQNEKQISEKKLNEYQKKLNKYKADLEVDDGYILKIKLNIEGEKKGSEVSEVTVLKINDEWSLMCE